MIQPELAMKFNDSSKDNDSPKCTQCGSHDLTPIPIQRKYRMAKYKCCSCGKLVCKEPLYCSEGKVWDARQTSFFIDFYRGGYFYGYPRITIQKTSSGIEYKYKLPHGLIFRSMHDPECLQKLNTPINYPKLTEDDWNHIVSTLFDKAHIYEWKSKYVIVVDIYNESPERAIRV